MKPKQEPYMSAAQKSRLMMWIGIASFILTVLSMIVGGTVTATKLNERVDQHERRLKQYEQQLAPLDKKVDEITFNLKSLMKHNGLEYTTVK